ncbi:MAG: hypothetical protein ACN6OP_02970 [Pseudomonadales bacterium]
MLDKILEDTHESYSAQNSNEILRVDIDYEEEVRKRSEAVEEWKSLGREGQEKFGGKLDSFF